MATLAVDDLNGVMEILAESLEEPWWSLKEALVCDLPEKGTVSEEEYNRLRAVRWAEELYRMKGDRTKDFREQKHLRQQLEKQGMIDDLGI